MRLFKISFFLFFLAILSFYTIKPHKRVVMSAEEVKQLSGEGYLGTRIISLPGFPKAYNPSIVPYKGGYLLSFRVDSYDLRTKVKHFLNHRISYLGIALLDREFNGRGTPELLEMTSTAPQDPRLYAFGEHIYLLFNDYARKEKGSQEMFLAEVIEKEGKFALFQEPKLLHYKESQQRVEKNWSPFAFESKLFVVYKIKPHTILEVDLSTGECVKVSESDSVRLWSFGENRGGTPCCSIGEEYLSFFHSCKKGAPTFFRKDGGRIFYMGAYTFENKPPFAVTKISPMPIGRAEDYEIDNYEKIVYPTGLVVEGNLVHLSWGKNDRMICITTFDKEKLLSSLR